MGSLEEFDDFSYITEVEINFNITVWDSEEVCELLNIDKDDLNHQIKQTGNRSSDNGHKTSFNLNFIKKKEDYEITTIGMYLLFKYRFSEEIELNNYFKELAIIDLLRYQGYKQKSHTKTKGTGNFSIEIKEPKEV